MRYDKDRRSTTRHKILASACRLFAARGFDAVAIDDVMRDCALTRGGFYAHFASKGELYRRAIEFGFLGGYFSVITSDRPLRTTLLEHLGQIIDESVGIEGRSRYEDSHSARFAFLAIDTSVKDSDVRTAYAFAVTALATQLQATMRGNSANEESLAPSLMALIIGAASMARNVRDANERFRLASSCKQVINTLLTGHTPASSFFWEGARGIEGSRFRSVA